MIQNSNKMVKQKLTHCQNSSKIHIGFKSNREEIGENIEIEKTK